eukprot:CCRYP_008588-RA/>CCRYP_008588-RA protein AED:0.26 eAED:0.22 QI:0/0/0/1/0/0/3/0/154
MTPPARCTVDAWSWPYETDCKELAKSLHDLNPAVDKVYKKTLTDPSFIMNIYHPSKDGVSKRIWEDGCWECHHIKTLLYPIILAFLDIGGNIGMWSLSPAAANYRTITIEHLPDNYERFCWSVSKNSFHNRPHLIKLDVEGHELMALVGATQFL